MELANGVHLSILPFSTQMNCEPYDIFSSYLATCNSFAFSNPTKSTFSKLISIKFSIKNKLKYNCNNKVQNYTSLVLEKSNIKKMKHTEIQTPLKCILCLLCLCYCSLL